jgi:hypothetical protein
MSDQERPEPDFDQHSSPPPPEPPPPDAGEREGSGAEGSEGGGDSMPRTSGDDERD